MEKACIKTNLTKSHLNIFYHDICLKNFNQISHFKLEYSKLVLYYVCKSLKLTFKSFQSKT